MSGGSDATGWASTALTTVSGTTTEVVGAGGGWKTTSSLGVEEQAHTNSASNTDHKYLLDISASADSEIHQFLYWDLDSSG